MAEKYVTIWGKLEKEFQEVGETVEDVVAIAIEGELDRHVLCQNTTDIIRELNEPHYIHCPGFVIWTFKNVYIESFKGIYDDEPEYEIQRIPRVPTLENLFK